MLRLLPSLNGLKAFEAEATRELHAGRRRTLSNQVKALEVGTRIEAFQSPAAMAGDNRRGPRLSGCRTRRIRRTAAETERLLQRRAASAHCRNLVELRSEVARPSACPLPEPHPRLIIASEHHVDFAREDIDLAVRDGNETDVGLDSLASVQRRSFGGLSP